MLKLGFLNACLRAVTMGSKFLLLFFLARYLTPGQVGEYGLVVATVSAAIYLIGLDFYVFNTREMLAGKKSEWARLIRDQLALHLVVYVVVMPLLLTVFFTSTLPWRFAAWFYIILVLEHLSQEAYRILVTISRPLLGNLVMFFRAGAWAYAVIALMATHPSTRGLYTVFAAWATGVGISILITIYSFRGMGWRDAISMPVDWEWIKRGIKISLHFAIGTLALRGIVTIDRYILEHYAGTTSVGVYVFYSGIGNAVQEFVNTGLIVILYPKIIAAYQQGHFDEFRALVRRMAVGSTVAVIALAGIAAVAIYPVVSLLHKPIYGEHLVTYWVILGSAVAAILGLTPHYVLYARHQDRAIVLSGIIAFVIAIAANFLLVPRYKELGSATATLIAMASLGIFRLAMMAKEAGCGA